MTVKYGVEADTMQDALQARPSNGGLMSAREATEHEFDATGEADDG